MLSMYNVVHVYCCPCIMQFRKTTVYFSVTLSDTNILTTESAAPELEYKSMKGVYGRVRCTFRKIGQTSKPHLGLIPWHVSYYYYNTL